MTATYLLTGKCFKCGATLQVKSRSSSKTVACPKCNSAATLTAAKANQVLSAMPPPEVTKANDLPPIQTAARKSVKSRRQLVLIATSILVLIAIVGAIPLLISAHQSKRCDQCARNLWQISTAVMMMNDAFGSVDDIRDKNGKPLLSWRVRALAFMEESALYNQFKRDEPWDSPHNKVLLEKMPDAYRCPSTSDAYSSSTPYQMITGPQTLFDGQGGAHLTVESIPDGHNATVLLVEASKEVPWTKPEDLPYIAGDVPSLSNSHPDGALVAFVDGSVRSIPSETDKQTVVALITPAGGESIAFDRFPVNQSVLVSQRRTNEIMDKLMGNVVDRTATLNASPVRIEDGKPVLTQRGSIIFPAGTELNDTPNGMYLHAEHIWLILADEDSRFEIRPIGKTHLKIYYGETQNSGDRFLFTDDKVTEVSDSSAILFPDERYEVFNSQGVRVFIWSGKL